MHCAPAIRLKRTVSGHDHRRPLKKGVYGRGWLELSSSTPRRRHHHLASALGQCGIFAALGPAVTLTATLGPLLASLLMHKSKRVGHGAGFTRVRAHPRPFASHDTTEASCSDASQGLELQTAGPTGHGPC